MSIRDSLLPILRCPYCHAAFRFEESPRPAEGCAEFGVLRCANHAFPVLDGIPIIQRAPVGMFSHTLGSAQVHGVAVEELVRLIEQGRPLEALVETLALPNLPALVGKVLGWRLSHGDFATSIARWLGKRAFHRRVLSAREQITARQIFEFYYPPGGPLDDDLAPYFIGRFGQPRHLAALALATNIRRSPKPVLDIACGAGHLDHYLMHRPEALRVVGVDLNFYQLWIARHWIAPGGDYICANASEELPFVDGTFDATFCSDAYHLIPRRTALLKEIERCAPGGMVILTRVGNAAVMPNEGLEETLDDYLREFAPAKPRVFDESELVGHYLNRRGSLSQPAASAAQLADCKWLSFIWNYEQTVRDTAPLQDDDGNAVWPHAVGSLALNPMYACRRLDGGDLHLHFKFPSIHYAYENHEMLSYHPRLVTLTRKELEALGAGAESSEISRLVRSFILVGMPVRFGCPPIERAGG